MTKEDKSRYLSEHNGFCSDISCEHDTDRECPCFARCITGKATVKDITETARAYLLSINKLVETDIQKRRKRGEAHHEKSVELYAALADIDDRYGDGFFCFKPVGDGRNGETLLYYLDIYFESIEAGIKP